MPRKLNRGRRAVDPNAKPYDWGKIKGWIRAGVTRAEVCRKLRRTYKALDLALVRAKAEGVALPPFVNPGGPPKTDYALAERLRSEGLKVREIAQRLGVNEKSLSSGLAKRRRDQS